MLNINDARESYRRSIENFKLDKEANVRHAIGEAIVDGCISVRITFSETNLSKGQKKILDDIVSELRQDEYCVKLLFTEQKYIIDIFWDQEDS